MQFSYILGLGPDQVAFFYGKIKLLFRVFFIQESCFSVESTRSMFVSLHYCIAPNDTIFAF